MAAFDSILARGFAKLLAVTAAPTLTAKNGAVARCVSTPVARSKEMRDAGYWPKFGAIAEITRADFILLVIDDRSVLTFRAAGEPATSPGVQLKVMGIEDDPADPCVKLTLKEQPA